MKSLVVSCLIFLFAVIGLSLASSAPKAEHEKKALCRFTVGEVKGQFIFYLLFSYFPEWLFQHKNFATSAVFGQKNAAWPQGRNLNFAQLLPLPLPSYFQWTTCVSDNSRLNKCSHMFNMR